MLFCGRRLAVHQEHCSFILEVPLLLLHHITLTTLRLRQYPCISSCLREAPSCTPLALGPAPAALDILPIKIFQQGCCSRATGELSLAEVVSIYCQAPGLVSTQPESQTGRQESLWRPSREMQAHYTSEHTSRCGPIGEPEGNASSKGWPC